MKREYWSLLISFIIIGAILRLYQLGFACLWTEELYTGMVSLKEPLQIWSFITMNDFNPPGYHLLVWVMRISMGYSEWVLRLPSAVAGVLLIPVIFYAGKEYKDELTGVICAGLVTVLYPLTYYSQFARAYSVSLLLFTIGLLYYLKIRNGNVGITNYIIFGLFIGINAYTHFYAMIPLGLLWCILFLRRNNIKRLFVSLGIAVTMCLPLIPMLMTFINGRVYHDSAQMPYGINISQILLVLPFELFSFACIIFALLIVIGVSTNRNAYTYEMLIVSTITIIVGLLSSIVTPFYSRYLLCILPMLVIVSAVPISEYLKDKPILTVKIILCAIIMIIFILQYDQFVMHYFTQKYIC
jgi:4-amino-4-deoxy-L-arabinose transferase-like glycosyltransferase